MKNTPYFSTQIYFCFLNFMDIEELTALWNKENNSLIEQKKRRIGEQHEITELHYSNII